MNTYSALHVSHWLVCGLPLFLHKRIHIFVSTSFPQLQIQTPATVTSIYQDLILLTTVYQSLSNRHSVFCSIHSCFLLSSRGIGTGIDASSLSLILHRFKYILNMRTSPTKTGEVRVDQYWLVKSKPQWSYMDDIEGCPLEPVIAEKCSLVCERQIFESAQTLR